MNRKDGFSYPKQYPKNKKRQKKLDLFAASAVRKSGTSGEILFSIYFIHPLLPAFPL